MTVVTMILTVVAVPKHRHHRHHRHGQERNGSKMKNVQIPYDLFLALLQYHLMMDDDYADEIRYGLEQKLEAMVRHEWYAKYKTAPTLEEREAARQRYLDERGVPLCFRWTTSPWER
mgnify:CR=1 FL=1